MNTKYVIVKGLLNVRYDPEKSYTSQCSELKISNSSRNSYGH